MNVLNTSEPTITLSKDYSNNISVIRYGFKVDAKTIIDHILDTTKIKISPNMKDETKIAKHILDKLDPSGYAPEEYDYYNSLYTRFNNVLEEIKSSNLLDFIYNSILLPRIPKFIYSDKYHQMKGLVNLQGLIDRDARGILEDSDKPFIALLNQANLSLQDLQNVIDLKYGPQYIAGIEKIQYAIDSVLNRVFEYWSQHDYYNLECNIMPKKEEDPLGATDSLNLWICIKDNRLDRNSTVRKLFEYESHGFIWFFSFLILHSIVKGQDRGNVILLLDEPGLSLHAEAQRDLLKFLQENIIPHNQVIYTTHSQFMIDSKNLDEVKVVENLNLKSDGDKLKYNASGTKVLATAMDANEDSLLPLQAALGYHISQNLFFGRNNLVVEGKTDSIYIQVVSDILQEQGKDGLSPDWTIVPTGGFGNVSTFVSLIAARTDLNLAVLIDYQKRNKQKIENWYKKKLINRKQVLTYADFLQVAAADVEDMFAEEFYLMLVNGVFEIDLTLQDISHGGSRIVKRIDKYFRENPDAKANICNFDEDYPHYPPAKYLKSNIDSLKQYISDDTLLLFEKIFDTLNKLIIK